MKPFANPASNAKTDILVCCQAGQMAQEHELIKMFEEEEDDPL